MLRRHNKISAQEAFYCSNLEFMALGRKKEKNWFVSNSNAVGCQRKPCQKIGDSYSLFGAEKKYSAKIRGWAKKLELTPGEWGKMLLFGGSRRRTFVRGLFQTGKGGWGTIQPPSVLREFWRPLWRNDQLVVKVSYISQENKLG